MRRLALALLALLPVAGCAGAAPGLTLKDAMISTVDALAAAEAKAVKSGITGFEPCDLTASFDVVSTTAGSLGVAAAPPHVPLGISAKVEHETQLGNTVTVDYKSPACMATLTKPPPVLPSRSKDQP